jgi:hypothetical protein
MSDTGKMAPMVEIGLLIDDSGSMGGPEGRTKFTAACKGADKLVEGLQYSNVPIAVTAQTFRSKICTRVLHNELPSPLVHAPRAVFGGGGTPTSWTTLDMLQKMDPKTVKALVVLTDGTDDDGYNLPAWKKAMEDLFKEGGTALFLIVGLHYAYNVAQTLVGKVPEANILLVDERADMGEVMYAASQVLLDFLASDGKCAGFTDEQRAMAVTPNGKTVTPWVKSDWNPKNKGGALAKQIAEMKRQGY